MGLRLWKHSSPFPSHRPEPAPGRALEPETETYSTSEPFSYQSLMGNRPPLRTARPPNRTDQQDANGRQRKRRRLLTRSQQERTSGQIRRARSQQLWNCDAAEGYALARSDVQLPSDNNTNTLSFTEPQWSQSSSRSSGRRRRRSSGTSVSPRRGRPPSLERQDAFRDERTAKSRHSRHHRDSYDEHLLSPNEMAEHQSRGGDEEAREIADLYCMGLLYDNEYERGAGFSLDRIVRDCAEEPAYSVRVRPRKRARQAESGFISLCSVDLAFGAFTEDEALAGWLMSGVQREEAADLRAAAASIVHEPPILTPIYELADDAASAASAEDFLDSAYVSQLSDCAGNDDASAWAIVDGCNGTNEKAPAVGVPGVLEEAVEEEGGVDPWVVLGHDGS